MATRSDEALIAIEDVTVERGGRTVLAGLDLHIRERRIGIVGANGSGKSTFARLLNGLVLPKAGRVTVDGLNTAKEGRDVRRRVGFVFQNPDNQIVYPTVGEDLAFGLKGRGLPRDAVAEKVAQALARFGLESFDERLAHELSGGERQLVALAGVMIIEPRWLVLDEPTTLLDLKNKRRLASIIETLAENVVMVTHDLDLVKEYDRVLVFDRGRLFFDGRPEEAIARYEELCR